MQLYTSKSTSINKYKLPSIYSNKTIIQAISDASNVLDYGGGKYDNVVEKFSNVSIYDKYNRTTEHNNQVLSIHYDIAICSNVLNVINDTSIQLEIVSHVLKYANVLYLSVYEGNKSGVGKQTNIDSWQENRTTNSYKSMLIDNGFKVENITSKILKVFY